MDGKGDSWGEGGAYAAHDRIGICLGLYVNALPVGDPMAPPAMFDATFAARAFLNGDFQAVMGQVVDVLETIIGADLFEFVEIFSDTEEVDSVSEEERLNMTQSITDPLTLAKAFVQKLAAGLPAPVGTTDPTHQMCTLSSLSSPDQFLL